MTDAINTGNFTVIDTETTGLSPKKNEIIEIGAVKFRNWEVSEKYDVLIKPKSYIPSFITSLTGISNEMVKSSPYFEDILDEFMAFVGDDDIVGQGHCFALVVGDVDCGDADLLLDAADLGSHGDAELCVEV